MKMARPVKPGISEVKSSFDMPQICFPVTPANLSAYFANCPSLCVLIHCCTCSTVHDLRSDGRIGVPVSGVDNGVSDVV